MLTFASSADLPSRCKTRFTVTTTTSISTTSAVFKREIIQAIVFSQGHFAPEAADFTNKNLLKVFEKLTQQTPDESLTNIIKRAFKYIQAVMLNHWKNRWPKSSDGHNSVAGTSTTLVLITNDGTLFAGNVGGTVLYLVPINQLSKEAKALKLTTEHVLSNPKEMQKLFLQHGSSVMNYVSPKLETDESADSGECCICWDKSKCMCQPEVSDPGPVPMIPLTRTLGDFWNLRSDLKARIVSDDPDVLQFKLDEGVINYLVFLSRNLAKCIDEELVKTAVSLKEDGTLLDPAKEIITAAILQLQRQKTMSKFENMSVLVVPISKISSVGRLMQAIIGNNSIFCIDDDDDTQHSSELTLVKSSMEELNLEHMKSEIRDPLCRKCVETISLIISNPKSPNADSCRKIKMKCKFLKHRFSNCIRSTVPQKIFRKYLRLIRRKRNHKSCNGLDDTGIGLELQRYCDTYQNEENGRTPALEPSPCIYSKDERSLEYPHVSVNIIQWRKYNGISFCLNSFTEEPSNQSCIQNSRQGTPIFSLDLNSLLWSNTYLLFCNKSCHVLVQFPANEIIVPETVKFYPLPTIRGHSLSTGYLFHISENVAGRLAMLQGLNSQLLGVYESIIRKLGGAPIPQEQIPLPTTNCGEIKEEFLTKNEIKAEVKQESSLIEKIKDEDTMSFTSLPKKDGDSNKTLLFSIPIQNADAEFADDRTIKVFLLHNSNSSKEDASDSSQLSLSKLIKNSEQNNDNLSTALMPYNETKDVCIQTDSILPYSWSSSQLPLPAILPPIPKPNPDIGKRKPLSSSIIKNDGPLTKKPRVENEGISTNTGGNVQNLKKNSVSCAFLARGCGGKCIIPKTSSKPGEDKSHVKTDKQKENFVNEHKEGVKTVEGNAIVSKVEGETHVELHIPEYSKDEDVSNDFYGGILPNLIGTSGTPAESENEISQEFDLFTEMESVAWANQQNCDHATGTGSSSNETTETLPGGVESFVNQPESICEDNFLNEDYSSHSRSRNISQEKTADSKNSRPTGLFGSLKALQKRLDSIVKPKSKGSVSGSNDNLQDSQIQGDNNIDDLQLHQSNSLPRVESQPYTNHIESFDLSQNGTEFDLHRDEETFRESSKSSIDKKDYRRRSIYQVCGGQRIRINVESIRRQTGKEPEICFKELEPKLQNEKSIPIYDLD